MDAVAETVAQGTHITIIEPDRRFALPNLRELWDARRLVWLLLRRMCRCAIAKRQPGRSGPLSSH